MSTDPNEKIEGGLTKREYFAVMALQGVEAGNVETEHNVVMSMSEVAQRAIQLADQLIYWLNE